MVFMSGLPDPCSRPMSWHHTLMSSTSATASANSADWHSKLVSSSPRSRPSEPSRSRMSVVGSRPSFGDAASHTPLVVCWRPLMASISWKRVPNWVWFGGS
jgi:hypothetical protein